MSKGFERFDGRRVARYWVACEDETVREPAKGQHCVFRAAWGVGVFCIWIEHVRSSDGLVVACCTLLRGDAPAWEFIEADESRDEENET